MKGNLTSKEIGDIVLMRAMNYELEDIADEVGVSRQTVSRRLDEVREDAKVYEPHEGIFIAGFMVESSKYPSDYNDFEEQLERDSR